MINEYDDSLIDRYLNRQMDAAEATAFEIRVLDEPELLEQVQLIEAMKQALQESDFHKSGFDYRGSDERGFDERGFDDRGANESAEKSDPGGEDQLRIIPVQTANILPFTGWLRQPLSMAASVLLAVMLLQQFLPGPGSSTSSSTAIGTVLLLENSRGTVPAAFRGRPPYLFQIDAGLGNQAESFKVSLHDDNNAEVLHVDDLQADMDGWIRLVVDQRLAGNYQVELAWADAQGAVQSRSFPLQVSE